MPPHDDEKTPSMPPASVVPASTGPASAMAGAPEGEEHSYAHGPDGTRLFVRRSTTPAPAGRPTVFLCDGILCDGFIWKYLWKALASEYPLVHFHYRGHGRSAAPKDPERVTIADHADDLMAVREHVGNPLAVLIGHSMGTQVCLETYHRHGEHLRALVLMCGSYGKVTQSFRGTPVLDYILPKLTDIVDKQPELFRAVWSRIPPELGFKLALKARDVDPDKIRAEDMVPYIQHMTHVDLPMFLRMLRGAGDHSAESYLGDVRVPVLVVAGERDTFTPASLSNHMVEAMPWAELLMVAGGSHVAPIEQPELVQGRLTDFLSRACSADSTLMPAAQIPE